MKSSLVCKDYICLNLTEYPPHKKLKKILYQNKEEWLVNVKHRFSWGIFTIMRLKFLEVNKCKPKCSTNVTSHKYEFSQFFDKKWLTFFYLLSLPPSNIDIYMTIFDIRYYFLVRKSAFRTHILRNADWATWW